MASPKPEEKTEKTKIEASKLEEYTTLLQSVYEAAKAAVTIQVAPGTEDPWIIHSIEAGIDLYTRKAASGSPIHHVRAAGFVEAAPEVVEYMFNSVTCRKSWDEHYEGGMDVCRINQSTRIQYITSRSPRPVPGRDLCLITRKENRDDGSIFVWSVSVEAHPATSGYVRALMHYSGLLISPTKKEKPTSQMVYAFGIDLKGDIPKEYVKVMTLDRAVMPFNGIGKLARIPAWIANVKRAVEKESRHFSGSHDDRRPSISVVDEKRSLRSPMSETRDDLDLPSPTSGSSFSEPIVERKTSGPSASTPTTPLTPAVLSMTGGGAAAAPKPAGARSLKEQFLAIQEGLPPTPYDSIILNAYNLFQEALDKTSGWEFVEKKGDIEIHSKQEAGISSPFMRGAAVVPFPADTIHYVWNKLRDKWNDTYLRGRVLEVIDKNTFVSYAAFSAPWPVSGRDIVSVCRRGPTDGGGWISINTSVQHNKMPKAGEGLVRGTLIFSGLWLQPVPSNPSHTRVVYVVAQNPNGTIPAGAVKKAAMKQPMSIQQVADLIAKNPEEYAQKAKEMIDEEKKVSSSSRPEEKENPLEDFKGYETSRVIDWELYERGSVDAQAFSRITPFTRCKTFIGVLASTLKFALFGGPAKKEKAPISERHIAGVLCVKVVGKTARHGPSRKFAESLSLQLSVGESVQDAKKFPHDSSFRIHDPSDSLIIRAYGPSQDEETKGRLEVGKLSLPVVDLWAPRGKNRKGGAKRGWYKMETKGQNEKSRREIFICLETAYVYSKLADLTAEYYSRHPGFLDPREVIVEEKEAATSGPSPSPTTPSGPSSALIPPEKRKSQYDAQILVENAYRVLDASEPIRQFLMALYALLIWKWPFLTGLTLAILSLSTYFPALFVVALSCIIFTVLAFTAANTHYGRVLEDSIQWRQEELARDEMIMKIVHGIKKREGRFPLDMLDSLREIQGKLFLWALKMERICGYFDWSIEDATSATLMFTTLSLIVAVIVPWRFFTLFLALSVLAWNSNLYKTLRWMAARLLAYWSRRIRMAATVG